VGRMREFFKRYWSLLIPIVPGMICIICAIYWTIAGGGNSSPTAICGEVKSRIEFNKSSTTRYITKFEFEGHTYLVLSNSWSSSGDSMIHDQNCLCLKKEK
jgi:hypothetical protein